MSEDGYRRGRDVERDQRPEVKPLYRPLLPWLWVLGGVLLVIAIGFSPDAGVAVVAVMHLFFAGLIYGDIKSVRRQGVEWGLSRHLWFGAAVVFPFVVPAYYLYSGRVIGRANRERREAGDRAESNDRPESDDRSESVDRPDYADRPGPGEG